MPNEDAIFVKVLKAHGGIPIVKSNMPQMTASLYTQNDLYGEAKNPYDLNRVVGGSSGGEGGLISSRCTPLGFGTDTFGSIRNPAAMCGVTGFRPTPDRLSWIGCSMNTNAGMAYNELIHPCIGPLAYFVDDLKVSTEALLSPQM